MNSTASNFNPNANVTSYWGGVLDISIGSGSYFNNEQHLNFSSTEECKIVSQMCIQKIQILLHLN